MKVVVTGGAGFIGSNLVEALLKKYKKINIVVLDNCSTGRKENLKNFINKIKFIKCDLSKKGSWIKNLKNAKWVFHLAALADIVPSIEEPIKYFDSNVKGTLNILEGCKKYKIKKIIYSASSSCYGIPDSYPTNEKSKIKPEYPYALTKNLGEQLIIHWSKIYGIKFVSLRFFNVYGLRSRTSGTYGAVFGVFLAQKNAGKPFTVVGDGTQTRDFTYVSDAVSALIAAANSNISNEIFNIGSGRTRSINELVKILEGKVIYLPKRPGEPMSTWADIKKAKKLLKWKPLVSLEEGVKILICNLDYWKKAPVWDKKKIYNATKAWFRYLK